MKRECCREAVRKAEEDWVASMQPAISDEEYQRLLRDRRKLRALEAGGVDNWQGYDIAMEPLWVDEEAEEEAAMERLHEGFPA